MSYHWCFCCPGGHPVPSDEDHARAVQRERQRQLHERMVTLGRNLAVAGHMAEAIDAGAEYGRRLEREGGFWDSPPPWVPNVEGKAWRRP